MNLDELINRVISVAQASGEAKRQNALEIATLNAGSNREVASMNAEAHKYAADSHSKETEMTSGAQRYTADQHLRAETVKADTGLRAADIGLLGHMVTAGATAHSADVNAAQSLLRGVAETDSKFASAGAAATPEDRRRINDDNAKLLVQRASLTDNPLYKQATTTYDPRAVVAQGLPFGDRSAANKTATGAPIGTQSAPPMPVASNRVDALRPGGPNSFLNRPAQQSSFQEPPAPLLPSASSLRVGTVSPYVPSVAQPAPLDPTKKKSPPIQDPTRLGFGATGYM